MLTPQAWAEYADKGYILAATQRPGGGSSEAILLGYAAFRLPRQELVLAHLVIAPQARRRGVARLLVDELTRRYGDRRGITVRCRRDFAANKMWPHLDFVALGDRPGRSLEGHPLTTWWRDHGHPDLLTWDGVSSSVVSVALDLNVFLDLHGAKAGTEAAETRKLFEGPLEGRIQVLVTPELHNEIDRAASDKERNRLRAVAANYPRLAVKPAELSAANDLLLQVLGKAPTRAQDISDLRHVAYAIAAGIQVVVTRDGGARRRLGPIARELAGVQLVSPSELVQLVDQAEDAPAYWPAALLGTGYEVREADTNDRQQLRQFLNNGSGETGRGFDQRLERLAEQRPRSHRLLYFDPSKQPVALLGVGLDQSVLDVSVLRMRPAALQSTLAPQLISRLRQLAGELSATAIRVTDPHRHPLLSGALLADGFRISDAGPVTLTSAATCLSADVADLLVQSCADLTVEEREAVAPVVELAQSLVTEPSPALTAALERQVRPMRVSDAPLQTWLIPIKPNFSAALFDNPRELFDRKAELGISIEHVYYRAGHSGETAPARVLWYASDPVRMVIACSDLIDVIDGSPEALYKRFRRLGVYTFDQVRNQANSRGLVRALQVINTETFDRPVSLQRLQKLAGQNSQKLRLVSASQINQGLFADIMKEARGGRTG
jgi:predicted nucleic acid-binding protein/GNAT superfamily N-acetyltransferase/predicted transcriptional regulator